MKDWIIGVGVGFVFLVGVTIMVLMFYGIWAAAHPAKPVHYNHGPQDPMETH